jgi:hypothetical protein
MKNEKKTVFAGVKHRIKSPLRRGFDPLTLNKKGVEKNA